MKRIDLYGPMVETAIADYQTEMARRYERSEEGCPFEDWVDGEATPEEASRIRATKRTKEAVVNDLCNAIVEYDRWRDEEWEFADSYGLSDENWTDKDVENHADILDNIRKCRNVVNDLLKEVTGNPHLEL